MTQEEIIKMEINNFIREKEKVTNKMKQSNSPSEIRQCINKILMINDILEVKLERLYKLKQEEII